MRATAPGAVAGPSALPPPDDAGWVAAPVPTTAAATLRAAGAWSLDGPARRFDAEDFWWRARIKEAPGDALLCSGGIATVADVWWNGALILSSRSMYIEHEIPITLTGDDELVIRCRALDSVLAGRRPRPRWRAPMIENQQLRWVRATVLGRTPGWSPPAAAVGPWRGLWIERRADVELADVRLSAAIEGSLGKLSVTCRAKGARAVEVIVTRGDVAVRAPLSAGEDGVWEGAAIVPDVARWWPHTHGEPALYAARIAVDGRDVDLGAVGFRDVAVDTNDGDFAVSINGARVFCRGACWTPLDPVSLGADRATLRAALEQAQRAGMNMLRVGGTMVYETDDFYDLCDELGILVWQEFMFANMDYPDEDATFLAEVDAEARQLLARLAARPSLAVLCGSSESEQQAAMWGAGRERWSARLFHEVLPAIARELAPGVPYWPSSAHGGAYPHQPSAGTTSYYGVGAYLRPLDDARLSEVRFASECLAFANIPGPHGLPGDGSFKVHHPSWKARSPRDLGAGWDFDDIRDHYVGRLFGVDPSALRYADHDRYLALGRAAVGEVMAATFAEWRSGRSICRGGLVWFLRDLWPGAGWGVVEASGAPKSAWYYLRRAFAPVAASISDEGLNGLALHVVNDRGEPFAAELSLSLWRAGEVSVARGHCSVTVPARGAVEINAIDLLDGFMDLSNAFRFGPPLADVVALTVRTEDGAPLAEAFHFPAGLPRTRELDVGLTAEAQPIDGGDVTLTVRARRFAQSITIDAEGFVPDDEWFHLAPGGARAVRLRRQGTSKGAIRGTVSALNAEAIAKIQLPPTPP